MNYLPAFHLVTGPLDFLIEVVLPVAIVGALWWWSARGERKRRKDTDEQK